MRTIQEIWESNDSTFEELISCLDATAKAGVGIVPWMVTGAIKKIGTQKAPPTGEERDRIVAAARIGHHRHLRDNRAMADDYREIIDFIDKLEKEMNKK